MADPARDMPALAKKEQNASIRPLMPGISPVGQPQLEDEINIGELLGTLWRGKWVIALCTTLTVVLGGYYAFFVAGIKFASEAEIVMEVRGQNVVDLESVLSGVGTDESAINTEIAILSSRTMIGRLVEDLDLIEDPEFNLRLTEPSPYSPREIVYGLVDNIRAMLGIQNDNPRLVTEQRVFLETIEAVRETLRVTNDLDSYIFRVSVTTEDPYKSALIANHLSQIYLDEQIATKFAATEYAVNWLSQRVTELEQELKQKEEAVLELNSATELMPEASLEALKAREKDQRSRIADLEEVRDAALERAEQLSGLMASGVFNAVAALAEDATLEGLRTDAAAGDEEARAAFRERVAILVEQARDAAAQAGLQVSGLQSDYQQLVAVIDAEDDKRQELIQRGRDAEATRVLYETFLARLKETSIQIGLQQADSRMLAEATPGEQVEPRRSVILAVAGLLGIMIGMVFVFLRQYIHRGFRSSDELEQATGYSVLGQIPKLPIRRRHATLGYLKKHPTSVGSEAIRNLRTSVLLSNVDNPPQVIMSTSSIPGEGKTTQSISLAFNLSGLGKRVLLIEGDIRRRTFSQYFRGSTAGGLVKVVSGTLTLEEAVLHEEEMGFDVLMGDKSSINAADLFSSERFRNMMNTARESYDYVLIDTPPVLVVPDARVIGNCADAIIYNVKWNFTSKEQVVAGLRQLSSVNLHITGLVLAQIDARGMKRYGYGGQYGAYANYGQGYYDK